MKVRVVSANKESLKQLEQEIAQNTIQGKYALTVVCIVASLALISLALML